MLNPLPDPHPDDEALEAFAMGRGDAAARSGIETHLQACVACHRRYVEAASFVQALKDAFGDSRSRQ